MAVLALPSVVLALFGASQILMAGILVYLLLFHPEQFPTGSLTSQVIHAAWGSAAFVAALGVVLIVVSVWMMKRMIHAQKFRR